MTDKEHEILEAQIAVIDRRRAEIDYQLSAMPHAPHCCGDCERAELEDEFRTLWLTRTALTKASSPA